MQGPMIRTTAVFERPFTIAGFRATLPTGECHLETEGMPTCGTTGLGARRVAARVVR